ncbi:hypothetical protein [Metabacillus malikii]|uniref:Uncharacterized protein n=1 Tax=Metabacillus malikii TaxID=1504265 RepID=A0ABT9ZJS0_9BACI|nr:hypothetical protein [Metabacillus malikii]MDQ0232541.1 hypothetical protein [Metabacillus malikii]
MSDKGQFQNGDEQYKMPNALKSKRNSVYRVGYTAGTGNDTNGKDEPGKRSDLP